MHSLRSFVLVIALPLPGVGSFCLDQAALFSLRCQRPTSFVRQRQQEIALHLADGGVDDVKFESDDAKNEAVVDLVADDEWGGLSMEISQTVQRAIIEDIKKQTRDFIGKDEYEFGDISQQIDVRVKDEVARFREKEDYEVGDFVKAMDEMSKTMTEELTGKPYQPGDLSTHLDEQIKSAVATYCGKDEYEFGDLTSLIGSRVQARVEEITGKPYEFGDVTRLVDEQRQQWVKDFLGEEAAAKYQFGDISKKVMSKITGKDDYQFGDVSKTILGNLFSNGKGKK